jgi:hypothetical protein
VHHIDGLSNHSQGMENPNRATRLGTWPVTAEGFQGLPVKVHRMPAKSSTSALEGESGDSTSNRYANR